MVTGRGLIRLGGGVQRGRGVQVGKGGSGGEGGFRWGRGRVQVGKGVQWRGFSGGSSVQGGSGGEWVGFRWRLLRGVFRRGCSGGGVQVVEGCGFSWEDVQVGEGCLDRDGGWLSGGRQRGNCQVD